jgi:ribosome modulation factor
MGTLPDALAQYLQDRAPEFLRNIVIEGIKAGQGGAERETCPYLYNTKARRMWLKGWVIGYKQVALKNEY